MQRLKWAITRCSKAGLSSWASSLRWLYWQSWVDAMCLLILLMNSCLLQFRYLVLRLSKNLADGCCSTFTWKAKHKVWNFKLGIVYQQRKQKKRGANTGLLMISGRNTLKFFKFLCREWRIKKWVRAIEADKNWWMKQYQTQKAWKRTREQS